MALTSPRCAMEVMLMTDKNEAKRVLLEFVHTSSAPAPDRTELVIGTGVHEQYTPEYRALTRDFYLKF